MLFRKNSIVIIFSIFVLILLGGIGLYIYTTLFPFKGTVEAINGSKTYRVIYTPNPAFEKALIDWNFWKKKSVAPYYGGVMYQAKKITIKLTDEIQYNYNLLSQKDKSVLASANTYGAGNTYTLNVYLSPQLKNLKTNSDKKSYLSGMFYSRVITALYNNSHPNDSIQQRYEKISQILQNNPNPFSISEK